MYKICFYVPESHLESVKEKIFATGAGKIGEYCSCAWQVLGEGQFMPLAGSNPYIGKQCFEAPEARTSAQIEKVKEYKVELVCADEFIHEAILALRKEHPYEEPAYQVWRLENI